MEENIEVKDVQKTEYLDKNGLDMLWAKVKENTNNQVEVERNRAVAKEDNITNSLSEFASKTTADAQYFRAGVHSYDIIGTFSKEHSLGTAWLSDYDGDPRLTIRNPERMNNQTILTANKLFITDYHNSQITISPDGVKMPQKTTKDIVTANNSTAHIGLDDDQAEYAYVAPLENGKVPEEYLDLSQYAKKTDIPEIDTSDFVSKTGPEDQVINSILGVTGGGIQVFDGAVDDSNEGVALMPTKLEFGYANNRSAILLRGSEVDGQNGSKIIIKTELENPYIKLSDGTDDDHTGGDTLTITNEGISNTDNNADHVYATDGSIADLTQYAKKSEISAGGNVNDVQVNGVSVVENKIANIKPATKEKLGVVKVGDGLNVADGTISVDTTAIGTGNYIPYESIDDKFGNNMYITKRNEGILFKSGAGNVSISDGEIQIKNTVSGLSLTNSFIWLKEISNNGSTETLLVQLDKNGLRLRDGDNDHVLTSYGSTIDITQYALKSVYDKKIAALEARIAALEAKHAEAA